MTMLGISIHPSQLEAASACQASYPKVTVNTIFKYACFDQGGQIIFMEDGKVKRRYFYL